MRRVVLLGAGHAHLHVIVHAAELIARGAEVIVVTPGDFWYSGLATGVLAGQYEPGLDVVDVGVLTARSGARVLRDAAETIDPAARRIALASGATIDYDLLSLDVGSEVPADALPGAARHALPVKPVSNLVRLRDELERRWGRGDRVRVVIVGGGNSGCEVAAAVQQLAARRRGAVDVTLLADTDRVLPHLRAVVARRMAQVLRRSGVRCLTGTRVTSVERDRVHTTAGDAHAFDVLVLATGLVPPSLVRRGGFPTDAEGAMVVDATLRSIGDPRVMGAGDCIAFAGRALPRIGVYAVRQAPVLLENLGAALDGRPPLSYRPQRHALLILNLGDGTALATWGPFAWRGRAAFWLKDRIDRRWLAQLRA